MNSKFFSPFTCMRSTCSVKMRSLRETLGGMSKPLEPPVVWVEFVRNLETSISITPPKVDITPRWAEKKDLLVIDAMLHFVKEVEIMEKDLELGDRCLLLEHLKKICAFAWVTFRDCRMGLWHMLHLPTGFGYLVYIHVQPEYRRKGVGTYLLNLMMQAINDIGYHKLISGTYDHWNIPMSFHLNSGFKISKKYTERRIFRFFSYPPKITVIEV